MSTGITVGTSTIVRYTVDVCYWECPLSEVPLYFYFDAYIFHCKQKLYSYAARTTQPVRVLMHSLC